MKNAIVIGATSGIGKEVAKLLVKDGYKVGITGRRMELLENLRTQNAEAFVIKQFDVTDTDKAIEALQELIAELHSVDLIFLCSGVGNINHQLDFSIEQKTIMTNVLGFTNIADWAFKYFEQREQGHFAAISSIASLRGNRFAPSYFASKAYQASYLEGLRQKAKHAKSKIKITDIRPGFVDTDLIKGQPHLLWTRPLKDASLQIYKAIKAQKKVVYITKRWRLIAIVMKIAPRFIYDRV